MVNKQDQTAIKTFLAFCCFRIEGQKLGLILVTKYIEIKVIKICYFSFFNSSMKQKFRKIWPIFDIEK